MSYEKFGTNDLIIQVYSEQPESDFGPHRIPRGIRVIHIPTGTVVSCDADRSQHRNRHLALTKLWNEVQSKPSYQELKLQLDNALAQNAELVKENEMLNNRLSVIETDFDNALSDIPKSPSLDKLVGTMLVCLKGLT